MSFIPSPQQAAIFDWVEKGRGSANVIAVAGSGKTTTLVKAIEKMDGYVFLGAYNKKIADELNFRLRESGNVDTSKVRAGTMHSAGFSAWQRAAGGKLEVTGQKVRVLIDEMFPKLEQNANSFIAQLISLAKQSGFGVRGAFPKIEEPSGYFDIIDHHGLDSMLEDSDNIGQLTAAAIAVFKRSLEMNRKVIDFDDMIHAPLLGDVKFFQQDWVLLDEAQDTNATRRLLARKMLKSGGRLIAVGDPRQAIYGFTGADADSLDLIQQEFGCQELPLTVTYRCPKAVVEMAQRWVSHIEAHPSAPQGVVRTIDVQQLLEEEQLDKNCAIICRNTKPIVGLAYTLIKKGIACHVEGREIGKGLITLARKWKGVRTTDALRTRLENYLSREVQKALAKDNEAKADAIKDKVETLFVIIDSLEAQGRTTIMDVCTSIEKMFADTPDGRPADVLILSTVHKSKGREWEKVYLLGRTHYMPSPYAKKDWQKLQENNLIYVAITRAKSQLIEVKV